MAVFLERLEQRIAQERAEIARIRKDAVTNEAAADARLAVLQQAADTLKAQPKLEGLIVALGSLGIKLEA